MAAEALLATGLILQGASKFAQARTQEKIAKRNSRQAVLTAAAEERRFRRDSQRRLALAKATASAQNKAFTGSVLDVLADQAIEAEEDAHLIRHGGTVIRDEQIARAGAFRQAGFGDLGGSLLSASGALFAAQAKIDSQTAARNDAIGQQNLSLERGATPVRISDQGVFDARTGVVLNSL